MRLLVCGNRTWTCVQTINAWMFALFSASARRKDSEFVLIHGGAEGADLIAAAIFERVMKAYARVAPDDVEQVKTRALAFPIPQDEWDRFGKGAGPRRNQRMLDEGKPTRVLAFGSITRPDGTRDSETGNMVRLANSAGIITTIVPHAGVMP